MDSEKSKEIVKKLQNDDVNALGELYELINQKIYNRCCFILKDEDVAADATQEIFLKAFKRIKTISDDKKIEPWINSICYNHCIDILRKKNKFKEKPFRDNDLYESSDLLVEIENYNNSIELQSKLKDQILELKEVDRLIIILHYWEGLTVKEISKQLVLGESAVKMKLSRTRDKLRGALESKGFNYTLELFIFVFLGLI